MKRSPSRSTTTPKRDKISPTPKKNNNRSLLVHIAELSTAVVEVAIKVINASLTQNQCFQSVTPPLTHVEIPRPRDATELMTAWSSPATSTTKVQPNLSIFPKEI